MVVRVYCKCMVLKENGDKRKRLGRLGRGMKWVGKLVLHLAVMVILTGVFWGQIKGWVYGNNRRGDLMQFVHYTVYEGRHEGNPVTSWNHMWHKGAPRTMDTTWLHFYLIQPMVKALGVYKSVRLYPALTLLGVVLFSYLLFYEVSQSFLIGLALAIPVALSQGLHIALTNSGVITSAISQMFLPAQLYFLVRFYQRKSKKELVLAGVMGALGIYSHGLTMAFFGLLLAGLFVLLATRKGEGLISKRTVINAAIFSLIAVAVGGLAFWPGFFGSMTGGGQTAMFKQLGSAKSYPEIWRQIAEVTDPGLWRGLGAAVIVWLAAKLLKFKFKQRSLAYLVPGIWMLIWWLSYRLGVNRLEWSFFPKRIFWTVPVVGGLVAARLMRPLAEGMGFKGIWPKLAGLLLQAVIAGVIIGGALGVIGSLDFKGMRDEFKVWEGGDFAQEFMEARGGLVAELVDINDQNQRIWTHDDVFIQSWSLITDMPMLTGFFHFATKRSDIWDAWTYEVFSNRSYEMQEMPPVVIKAQAEFFINWFGVKVLTECLPRDSHCTMADHFWQEDWLVDKKLESKEWARRMVTIKDEYTSGLMEPVIQPVIGFVGSDSGYRSYILNLATLGMDTSKVMVLRLGGTVAVLDKKTLAILDGVVINEQERKGVLDGGGWRNLKKFVESGGKVWIETGGNSVFRDKGSLPGMLPGYKTSFSDLGEAWQMTGELASEMKAFGLSPLKFDEDAWKLSYFDEKQLIEGVNVLLSQAGKPIVVERELGKGKVLWSGVNWFYRYERFRDNWLNEVKPVKLLTERLFGEWKQQSEVEFVKPEETRLKARGIKGVVYKYNMYPGWTAYAESEGKKKKLEIYPAGPEVMYVSVPEGMRDGEVEVVFKYKGSLIDWISLGITIVGIGVVGIFLVTGRVVFSAKLKDRLKIKKSGKSGKKGKSLKKWWDDED